LQRRRAKRRTKRLQREEHTSEVCLKREERNEVCSAHAETAQSPRSPFMMYDPLDNRNGYNSGGVATATYPDQNSNMMNTGGLNTGLDSGVVGGVPGVPGSVPPPLPGTAPMMGG
jgi:hypothetical protein